MSLFPAYPAGSSGENENESRDTEWLSNSSFNFLATPSIATKELEEATNLSSENESAESRKLRAKLKKIKKLEKKKEKKKKKEKVITVKELITEDCDLYCVDKTRRSHYLNYTSLHKSCKPRYHLNIKSHIGPKYYCGKKKEKTIRYFVHLKKETKEVHVSPEEELLITKKAEEFNKKLCEDSPVSDWIEFVEFQDEFFRSQHISYNTESERKRGIYQKKLNILEKALSYNPKNEELLKYWLRVGTEVLSPDELLNRIYKMLEDSPESMALWLTLISFKQESLALSSFPSVTELYKKAINTMRKVKTDRIADRDSDVLELLFHYCKFLDQSGQWEILLTILKNNLHLNFGAEVNLDVNVDDQRVKKLEDEIISNEKQPIWVIWRRMETLREGLHFMPVAESVDYPQRCVSTDDIIEFLLHFHRDTHFRLIIMVIMLLKVPLLPMNSCLLQALYKNGLPWTLDSPELILSSVFHSPAAHVKVHYLKRLTEVTSGPQYLRNVEGQSEFLELVHKTFQECMNFVQGKEKVFLGLWWLRFNRWLCMLDKQSLASLHLPAKKMKNLFKDFMKNPENRDNLLFYCEYSLFEYFQGNIEASIKTLKTLITSRASVYHLVDELEKAALCHVYKCLCEIYVATGQIENAVALLVNLGRGASLDSNVTNESIKISLHKFEHVAIELIHEMKDASASLEQYFIPQFSLEWITCFMWLVALKKSTAHVRNYVQEVCSKLDNPESTLSTYARESLWESLTVIYWALERNNVLPLAHVTKDSLRQFPCNLKMLSILACIKLEDHGLWGIFKQSFLNPPTLFGCVMLICVALQRMENDREGFGNRLKSLLQQITAEDGRLSSVIHCLRLKFLFDFDSTNLDVAHVNALESCPWNKRIYMSAVAVLPNKLMELTDVMIEKELRIHVTPDEIQEIRD